MSQDCFYQTWEQTEWKKWVVCVDLLREIKMLVLHSFTHCDPRVT